jgi:hypothetical protein
MFKQLPDNLCVTATRDRLEGIAVLASLRVDVGALVNQLLYNLTKTKIARVVQAIWKESVELQLL